MRIEWSPIECITSLIGGLGSCCVFSLCPHKCLHNTLYQDKPLALTATPSFSAGTPEGPLQTHAIWQTPFEMLWTTSLGQMESPSATSAIDILNRIMTRLTHTTLYQSMDHLLFTVPYLIFSLNVTVRKSNSSVIAWVALSGFYTCSHTVAGRRKADTL